MKTKNHQPNRDVLAVAAFAPLDSFPFQPARGRERQNNVGQLNREGNAILPHLRSVKKPSPFSLKDSAARFGLSPGIASRPRKARLHAPFSGDYQTDTITTTVHCRGNHHVGDALSNGCVQIGLEAGAHHISAAFNVRSWQNQFTLGVGAESQSRVTIPEAEQTKCGRTGREPKGGIPL